jgi:hypothetical protein
VLVVPSINCPVTKDFSRAAATPSWPEALIMLTAMPRAVGCASSPACPTALMLFVEAVVVGESGVNRLCTTERMAGGSMMTARPSLEVAVVLIDN